MSEWYLARDGKPVGPYQADHIRSMVRARLVAESTLVWRQGLDAWISVTQALPELEGRTQPMPALPNTLASTPVASVKVSVSPWSIQGFANRVADLAGVERLEGFSLRQLLSASFKRYSSADIESHFSVGVPENTPLLPEIEPGWPKPWMFVRLLAGTAALFFGFLGVLWLFPNPKLLPGMIIVGSFAAPLATLVFFFELNSPRNVSLYLVLRNVMLGGLVSIAFALFLFANSTRIDFGPPLAGVIEETGKLLTVFLLGLRLDAKRYPYMLNGMLFGAAVGAGFAAFESAGYAFEILSRGLVKGVGLDVLGASVNIILRGLLAPFGHIVWTALVAGALWRVKLDQPLRLRMLVHPRVLKMLFAVMLLHAAWNFAAIDLPFLGKHWLLGFVAWVLAFSMLQTGLKQIKAAQATSNAGKIELSGATVVFKGVSMVGMAGKPKQRG